MESVSNDTRDEAFALLEISLYNAKWIQARRASNVLPVRLHRIIAPEKFDDGGNPNQKL